jgi:hypothetical protein
MSMEQLEREVIELKAKVAELTAKQTKPWSLLPAAGLGSDEEIAEMQPYTDYFRQTGDLAPPFWKPGDPIPEPDHWEPTPLPKELVEAHEAMESFGRYYRVTGQDPPPDWKPGDPIPEPDEEWCPR